MPSLALLATSPPLLSAALAAAVPADPPVLPAVAPLAWTLAAAQDTTASPSAGPPGYPAATPEGEPPMNEIVVEGDYGPPASDPAEAINLETYRITQAVDEAVIEPIAYAYRDGLPEPIRDGLGNVVKNLGEPSNALNFLLQGKVGKAFETLGRLAINSTLGVGGLFDVAAAPGIGLPYRRNGFANTLGYYGVGPGPYLYLPVTGATTVRDLGGSILDQLLLPIAVGKPFNRTEYAATYFVVNGLDQRLDFDEELAAIAASDDPYAMRRDTYLAKRRRDIAMLKGEPISEEDRLLLEELSAQPAVAEEQAQQLTEGATPVEPPVDPEALPSVDPEALLITQPR
jgi:phospholipid-binding lipoprotein MlaA